MPFKNTVENLTEFKEETLLKFTQQQEAISALDAAIASKASDDDLGNNLFTPVDSSIIVDLQHAYKIGRLIFIHVIFHRSTAPDATATIKIGSFSKRPLHTHAFPIAGFNENTNNAVSESGAVMTNGDVYAHFTKTTATSNVKFDMLCIYCEGVLLGAGQNTINLGDTATPDPEEGSGE